MARGINKVILIGNLGADPEARYTPTGTAVVTVNIATSSGWKDKQSGEMQERTEWHRVVFFNRLAEIVNEYLKKGSKVYVEGSLRTRKWTDKSGVEKYTTEIIADEMQMLDGRGASQNTGSDNHYDQTTSSAPSKPSAAPAASAQTAPAADFDDDIPF
ncbi:MAG TPA: single-stranded DNA-binding protein [Gammaproteobacteria bacterium]|nr:single-stranded DNA-binding protein [Gammaproteobacteria bacterium]